MISAMLSTQARREKLQEERKRHEEGKNCRVVIIQERE